MKINWMILVVINFINISSMANAQIDSSSHLGYIRETVIETKANEPPLNLRLYLKNRPNPFSGKPKNCIDTPDPPDFVLSGDLNMIIYAWDSLKVFQLKNQTWANFDPPCSTFGFVRSCFPGPNSELYVNFENRSWKNETASWKFVKYRFRDNGFVIDSNFTILQKSNVPFNEVPIFYIISPDNNIYFLSRHHAMDGHDENMVYDSLGNFVSNSSAWCNLNNGIHFCTKLFQEKDFNWYAQIFNPDNGDFLFPAKVMASDVEGLIKCTFDNSIIWEAYSPDNKKIFLDDSLYFWPERHNAFILNTAAKDTFRMDPYNKCHRDDFKYYNIGPLTADFSGDLSCFVVYFNTPGKITGDEKIVLYRWRKIQEK